MKNLKILTTINLSFLAVYSFQMYSVTEKMFLPINQLWRDHFDNWGSGDFLNHGCFYESCSSVIFTPIFFLFNIIFLILNLKVFYSKKITHKFLPITLFIFNILLVSFSHSIKIGVIGIGIAILLIVTFLLSKNKKLQNSS